MKYIEERTVIVDGRKITYQLERKSVKNLNLRIRKDGSVYVSANKWISQGLIDSFVMDKGQYIFRAIDKFKELEEPTPQPRQFVSGESFSVLGRDLCLMVSESSRDFIFSDDRCIYLCLKDTGDFAKRERMVSRFFDGQCQTVFGEVLSEIYPVFQGYGVAMPVLRVREMRTRWGSCLVRKGIITLNKRLLEAPKTCIEYVVTHELCHFIHPNHSKEFYQLMTMLMPDWKERKHKLNKMTV